MSRIGKEVNTISFEIQETKLLEIVCDKCSIIIGTNRVSKSSEQVSTVVKNIKDVCGSFSRRKLDWDLSSPRYYSVRHELEKRKQGSSLWRTQICQTNQVSKKVVKSLCRWLKIFLEFLEKETRLGVSNLSSALFSSPFPSFWYYSICHELEKRWTQFRNLRNKAR